MKILGIIPARYASSRFPGKPLVMIDGKSMIRRVFEQARKCTEISEVVIATDSEIIANHIGTFGGNFILTSVHHKSGTERCLEALNIMSKNSASSYDIVINIQGDEPFIDPGQISELIGVFSNPEVSLATLVKKIKSPEELTDPNVVKVIFDRNRKAIYFSRQAIPFVRGKESAEWIGERDFFKHIGIYGYRTDVLRTIVNLPVSSLETAESLEQLRWIENGYPIHIRETEYESIAIDTPADLLKITNRT